MSYRFLMIICLCIYSAAPLAAPVPVSKPQSCSTITEAKFIRSFLRLRNQRWGYFKPEFGERRSLLIEIVNGYRDDPIYNPEGVYVFRFRRTGQLGGWSVTKGDALVSVFSGGCLTARKGFDKKKWSAVQLWLEGF